MVSTARYDSPLGGILIAADEAGLTGLWFDGQKYFARALPAGCEARPTPVLREAERWLDVYFSGNAPGFTPPLSYENISSFRKRVWEIMLDIPFGKTTTYGKIAKQIEKETGKRVSAQAVGGAVGHNSIALIIPCHRVLGSNSSLTGYAGGIDKKIKLLKLEGMDITN